VENLQKRGKSWQETEEMFDGKKEETSLTEMKWRHCWKMKNLPFIDPCIANIFAEYNQQDAVFQNFFFPVRCSAYFIRVFRPSSGAGWPG